MEGNSILSKYEYDTKCSKKEIKDNRTTKFRGTTLWNLLQPWALVKLRWLQAAHLCNICDCSLSSPRTAPSVHKATRMRLVDVTLRWYAVRYRRFGTNCRSRLQGSRSPFTLEDVTYRLSQNPDHLSTTQTCLTFQYSEDLIYTAEEA